jgi:Sulfotransferase family
MEEHGADDEEAEPWLEVSGLRRRIGREIYFLRRAVRNPDLFRRRGRRAVSPKVAFVDRNHDPARTLLVVGSARSGTTWLAEVLSDGFRGRLVFEPLRAESVPLARPVRFGQFLDPGSGADPTMARVLDRIMTGRVRSRWTDDYNTVRLPHCRVVKEIRATNLLPWMVRRYPRTPVVYLLRHPVPSAWSVSQLGWPDNLRQFTDQGALMEGPLEPFQTLIREALDSNDPFRRLVLRWCLENVVPIQMLEAGRTHVVFYEQMVDDPRGELAKMDRYIRGFNPGPWNLKLASVENLDKPSHTNYRQTDVSSGPGRLDNWRDEVPASEVEAALALVQGFGLDRIYGESTRPLIGPEAVLLGGAAPTAPTAGTVRP